MAASTSSGVFNSSKPTLVSSLRIGATKYSGYIVQSFLLFNFKFLTKIQQYRAPNKCDASLKCQNSLKLRNVSNRTPISCIPIADRDRKSTRLNSSHVK